MKVTIVHCVTFQLTLSFENEAMFIKLKNDKVKENLRMLVKHLDEELGERNDCQPIQKNQVKKLYIINSLIYQRLTINLNQNYKLGRN